MKNELIGINPLLKRKATLNPYRHALSTLYNRLLWDFSPIAWTSRWSLSSLKDIHKGEKAVILCNGPSLNQVDFSLLTKVSTFGLNKINLLFDRSSFRPSYIIAVNPLVIEQNYEFYNQTTIPLFIDSYGTKFVNNRENVYFLHSSHQQKFARDISMSIWQGYTVTFVALQVAFHLGFEKIALVGCDHYFNSNETSNQLAISKQEDDSHFDSRYFSNGMKWHLPDIAGSEYSYNLANAMYEAHGRKIYNSTVGGKLEIFTRINLKTFIETL